MGSITIQIRGVMRNSSKTKEYVVEHYHGRPSSIDWSTHNEDGVSRTMANAMLRAKRVVVKFHKSGNPVFMRAHNCGAKSGLFAYIDGKFWRQGK